MYCDTKHRIASALRDLMNERPLRKITVQDLMERSQMKRQSFYYHFRDIWDVVEWICHQQLAAPLLESNLGFEAWIIYALQLINAERVFYRKILMEGNLELFSRFCMPILWSRMAKALFGTDDRQRLSSEQLFAIEYECQSILFRCACFLYYRRELNLQDATNQLRCLISYHKWYDEGKAIS